MFVPMIRSLNPDCFVDLLLLVVIVVVVVVIVFVQSMCLGVSEACAEHKIPKFAVMTYNLEKHLPGVLNVLLHLDQKLDGLPAIQKSVVVG